MEMRRSCFESISGVFLPSVGGGEHQIGEGQLCTVEWGRCHGKGGVSDDVSTVSVHPDVINVVTCNVGIGCSTLSQRGLESKEELFNELQAL